MAYYNLPQGQQRDQIEENVGATIMIQHCKQEAESKLQQQDYVGAYDDYSYAIRIAQAIPFVGEEMPKLLCNRSMVLLKMRRYPEALADAMASINDFPYWIKGFWRASQVYKEQGQLYRAVDILNEGLDACRKYSYKDDQLTFFTEMATILSYAKGCSVNPFLRSPDSSQTSLKVKVIQRLIFNKAWEAISYLVTGLSSGDNDELAESFCDLDLSFVPVGDLLRETSVSQRKSWGIHLAITLLGNGSSFEQMELALGQATIHIGVQSALETGDLEFLKFLLATFIDSQAKKDMIDKNGDSAVHLVVKSGKINTTLGESILRLLMNSGCTAYLKNMSGQLPIDYLKPTDQGFSLLQAAKSNADEEIRKQIIMFKNKGNDALKNTNNGQAIQMYTKGLQLCGDNSVLKREAAVLLSNRSNVYSMMGMHKEALKDADESIKSDNSWYKGYWRKGQELKQMKRFTDAYTTFLSMFTSCYDVYPGDKLNFMTEAAILFKDIPDLQKRDKYKMLSLGDRDMWTNILIKLSKTGDWLTIRYLLMGMSMEVPKGPSSRGEGVAALASTNNMSFVTVFEYLKTIRHMTTTASWLTPTLVVLLYRHKGNYLNFLADERDTCVHAVVRYALITGHIDLLNEMPIKSSPFRDEYLDGRRETPFHVITKYKHTEDVNLMVKVARVLIGKQFTASMMNKDKCLAIDYVSEDRQKPLYDVLAKVSWKEMQNRSQDNTAAKKPSLPTKDGKQPNDQSNVPKPRNGGDQGTQTRPNDSQVFKDQQASQTRQVDPQILKERGNEEFRNGNYLAAVEIYTEAIGIQKAKMKEHVHHSRDLAILYANRSECFLKTFVLDKAMNDAMESVSYDGHWFKAHMKVGKVLGAKQNHEGALQAYTNALNELASEKSPEKSQREILASYCFHYMNLDNRKYPLDKVKNLKITTNTWALVTYDFITNGNWNLASFSFIQFRDDEAPCIKVERVNLRPICELQYVKICAWCIDLLRYFLICGSDYNTMTTYTGDRYFHATIRLCIASESFGLVEYVLPNIVVPKGDQNLQDDKGNTALHTITRDQAVDWRIRLRFIIMLIEAEVNPLTKNNEGKYAVVYLPRNEERAIQILANVMRQQEDVERIIKQTKMQQQQEARKQSQSKPNASATPQGRQPQPNRRQEDDAWKQSYMPKQPSRPTYDKCRKCDEVLEECRTKIKTRTGYAYFDMAKVIRENNHNKERHQKIVDEMLCMITDSIAKTLNPEIPERLAKIPYKYYQRIVTGLVKGENWRQLDVIVDEHRKHHGQTDLLDYAKGIKLPRVIIHSSLKGSHQLLTKIIESMLKSGAVIENEGKRCIQAAVQEEQFKVLETLFNHGACPSHLSVNQGDTPIHAALSIAIERDRGNFSIFNLFLEMFDKNPEKYHMLDPNEQDKNGDSLYHLVAKMKYNSTVQKATELLCDKKISSNVKNNEGKLPIHYLNAKNDRRLQFFRLASVGGPTKISSKKPKATGQQKKFAKTKIDNQPSEQNGGIIDAEAEDLLQYERAEEVPTVVEKPVIRAPLRKDALRKRIEELIYELDDVAYSKYSSRADNLEKPSKKSKKDKAESQTPKPQDSDKVPVTVEPTLNQEPEPLQQEIEQDLDDDEEESIEEQFQFDPQVFENLEWEVECTADVWKALRDKHVLPELKQRIVCKIQHLAAGEWTQILCKKLHHVPETLRLYEAKITKGGRIIWELAIAFSPRLSESAERILECNEEQLSDRPVKGGKIYSEIIRVWDIVFDHDKIYSSVQRIVKSHTRGESCIIQKKLKGVKHEQYSNKKKRVPRIYAETDLEKSVLEEVKQYFPPASANETEYHILKFYSFSSNLISHILQNIEIKVDFPFRVTDLEHAIINLQSNAPILLLGRSGTGKTTCCLYRLWSRFLWYWTKAKEADAPLLPRGNIYKEQRNQEKEEEDLEEVEDVLIEEENVPLDRQISGVSQEGATAAPDIENEAEEIDDANGQKYDHLHQVFITKNAVLCNEVQKNFRELMHACDLAKNHLEAENQNLPNRLQDLNDYQFPLFVTSRQLLLMLDASIDEPYFFDRTEDGSLKVDIQGWTDGDGPLSILPLLQEDSDEESDSDDEEDEILEDDQDNLNQDRLNRKRVPPRREMTYELFAESIWPHMNKGIGKKYHPSLVWTEIMSFIKGSYEALSKPTGYLEKEEYFDLGRKRAPNFSGEREHIYTLFKRYEHARKQKFLFDETDLVRNVYQRVCKQHDMNWVIHQIFVDETQDFTQAELCLLLRLCQNPNDMFLTGDTAQGIMRGISFRFSDLKSLFFYASHSLQAMGKTSGVAIPKQVYQLTHNYRSHAGILSLASSILDVMVEFFPESFDRLNKDQGLFHGPQPVLLESCSFSDLALLLRGNKRKTSHIEFGAHQAILVVNDAARENVPEELQCGLILTIYEAKGLEFDDILLYNFFKDSQASKEWRVVTDFLERLSKSVKTGTESLVTVSTEILQQKDRPRALTFDPNQHKVLNSELKHLYTAVTRARVNVWIFDEDMDKRAPMFEYFKAQHLVKAISSDYVQNLSTNGMFAEESTPEEWLKRAQDFMKHNLYEVAAKCYRQGGEPLMEKVAMSHQRALKASRIKDNPAKMREEFMLAAEQYLEVNLPVLAAKCLQNARERELLAHLYEKMGQLEKAAETYRKLRRPIESSACYERLGFFDKAIDTLYEQEMYDMAFDTLKRFRIQKKEFEEKGKVLPQHLKEHAPRKEHTEEQLAYMSAGMYHTAKNVGKMLASLNRLSSIQDRVDFLRKHHNHQNEYMSHAAKILRDNGQENEAAQLYIDQGQIDQALLLARDLGRKDWIGYCLVVEAQIQTSIQLDGSAISDKKDEVVEKVKEAFDLFKNLQDKNCYKFGDPQNGAGEASLLFGQLTHDTTRINLSWGAFNKAKPYRNEVAQLECMNWMVNNSNLTDRKNLVQVVKGMENLYGVLKVMIIPGLEDKQRLDQILRFYGLESKTNTELIYNPTLKPRILGVLKSQGTNINEKFVRIEISHQKARFSIAQYLLTKGKHWYKLLCLEFERQHKMLGECSLFSIGIRDQCQTPCSRGQHNQLSELNFRKLIELDILFVEMESYVQSGAKRISAMPDELKRLQETFLNPKENDYMSCKLLLNSIYTRFSQKEGITISTSSEALRWKKMIGQKRYYHVRIQLERMLGTNYDRVRDKNNKMREKNVELFMNMILIIKFFNISTIPLHNILKKFEQDLLTEYRNEHISTRYLEELGFLLEKDLVHCLVRRFLEAYEYLSSTNNNPDFALRQFSKFIQLERRKNHTPMLPDINNLMLWIEFFSVTAFCLECKFTTREHMSFVIPASYLSIVNFVDASFLGEQGVPTFEAINRYNHVIEQDLIRNRTERLVGILAGTDRKINIIRLAFRTLTESMKDHQPLDDIEEEDATRQFEYTKERIESITIAERVLVASLVYICNMGGMVYTDSETHVIGEICRIRLPEHCPERLAQAVRGVQSAKGIADVVVCLKALLVQREEKLLHCWWQSRQSRRHGIELDDTDIDVSIFNNSFFLTKTEEVLVNPNTFIASQTNFDDEETATSAEEKEKIRAEHKEYEEQQRKKKSAQIIHNFFKHVKFLGNCQNLRELCEKEQVKEDKSRSTDIFRDIIVNDKICGICGVYFKSEERSIEPEQDFEDHEYPSLAHSVNQPTSPTSSGNILHKLFSGIKSFVGEPEKQAATTQENVERVESYCGLTLLQKHERSESHLSKQQEFKLFQGAYNNYLKRDVDKMKVFIEKYELKSSRIKNLYPDNTLEIAHTTRSYDTVVKQIKYILENRDWRDQHLHQKVKEMIGHGKVIYEYVLEKYVLQSKISTKRPLFSNMDMKTIMMILTSMMNLSQWLQNQRPKSITIASTNRQEKDVENKSSYELDQMIYKHRPIKQACLLF